MVRVRRVGLLVVGLAAAGLAAQPWTLPAVAQAFAPTGPGDTASVTLVDPHNTPPVPGVFSFDDLRPRSTLRREQAPPPVPPPAPVQPATAPVAPRLVPPGGAQGVLVDAYLKAVAAAPAACHLRVEHLAAIGQVESGSVGGRAVDTDHRVVPAVYGPVLDGGPFAVIRDTDGGRFDGDKAYDRAVGPMQFIPSTWAWAGADGDADGIRDPQNVYDAALATAGYLCRNGRDLDRSADLRAAVLSYNHSEEYLATVLAWVDYFRTHGLGTLATVRVPVVTPARARDITTPAPPPRPPTSTATTPSPTTTATPSPTTTTATPSPTTSTATPSPTTTATPTPTTTTTTPSPTASPTTATAPPSTTSTTTTTTSTTSTQPAYPAR